MNLQPIVIKGYTLPVKQVAKATALALVLSLLSGCSSGGEQAKCEIIQRAVSEQSAEVNSLTESALIMVNPELSNCNIVQYRLQMDER
jgi:uncharacterized protein YcfL